MKSKQFNNAKISIFGKTKQVQDEFGDPRYIQINFFEMIAIKMFRETKSKSFFQQYPENYGAPYIKKIIKWVGNRITNLIDNCLRVI